MIDFTDKEFSELFAVQENQLEFKVKKYMYSKDRLIDNLLNLIMWELS